MAVPVSAGSTAGGDGAQIPARASTQPRSCTRLSPRMFSAASRVAALAGSAANRRTAAVAVTNGLSASRCMTERSAVSRESSRSAFHPVTITSLRARLSPTRAAV